MRVLLKSLKTRLNREKKCQNIDTFIFKKGFDYMKIHIKTKKTGEDEKIIEFAYAKDSTFKDLLNTFTYRDYVLSSNLNIVVCYKYIKYIISTDNKIYWNMKFEDIKIIDYLNTFQELPYIWLDPMGLGSTGFDYEEVWRIFIEVIESAWVLLGVYGNFQTGMSLGKAIFNYFKKINNKSEIPFTSDTYLDAIYSRNKWNAMELSEMLELDKEYTKDLLKIIGYEYNNNHKMYVLDEKRKDSFMKLLRKNINKKQI